MLAQLGDALGEGVGVLPARIASIAAALTGLGNVEIGQADREIDRVLHRLGHVERLADARGVDLLHPVGDPGVVHGRLELASTQVSVIKAEDINT